MTPGAIAEAMNSPASIVDNYLLASAAYSNVIIRTRYTEDALKAAIARGIRQYVMIGAGFDSFALRRPDFAADLEIFEIDHPATLAFTYIDARLLKSDSESYRQLAKTVASLGESFLSGFDPTSLAIDLRACGLTLSEDMDMQHAAARVGT
jgi:O-methyltransferase involved in polyketide biosynthesis